MRVASSLLAVGSMFAPFEAVAIGTHGPSDGDVLSALKHLKLSQVRSIRCQKRELGTRINMGGEPTAKAQCSYRYLSTANGDGATWKRGTIKLSYSGFMCGDEGQEADLICYNWQQDIS